MHIIIEIICSREHSISAFGTRLLLTVDANACKLQHDQYLYFFFSKFGNMSNPVLIYYAFPSSRLSWIQMMPCLVASIGSITLLSTSPLYGTSLNLFVCTCSSVDTQAYCCVSFVFLSCVYILVDVILPFWILPLELTNSLN